MRDSWDEGFSLAADPCVGVARNNLAHPVPSAPDGVCSSASRWSPPASITFRCSSTTTRHSAGEGAAKTGLRCGGGTSSRFPASGLRGTSFRSPGRCRADRILDRYPSSRIPHRIPNPGIHDRIDSGFAM